MDRDFAHGPVDRDPKLRDDDLLQRGPNLLERLLGGQLALPHVGGHGLGRGWEKPVVGVETRKVAQLVRDIFKRPLEIAVWRSLKLEAHDHGKHWSLHTPSPAVRGCLPRVVRKGSPWHVSSSESAKVCGGRQPSRQRAPWYTR